MRTDIARLDLRQRRRSVIGYSVGLALYTLVVVALYPAFKDSTSLDSLVKSDATAAALFGISGPLSSSGGWLNANIYANFFPLLALLMTIGYGAAAVAGQDDDGTLCLLVALARSRTAILLHKVGAMVLQVLVLTIAVLVCVVMGRSFQLTTSVGTASTASLALMLMALDFGILALAVGALTGRRGTAIGVTSAVAAASYLVSSLAPVISWLHSWRYVSLFYWSVGNNQITDGASVWDLVFLTAVGAVVMFAAVFAFRRADLR